MGTMFKETEQKCAWDQRGARKAEMLETDKMPTKQKQKTDEGETSFKRVCLQMHSQLIRKRFSSAITAAYL